MNLHSKKNSLLMLLIALLFIITSVIITEYVFDFSIITASYSISFLILGLLTFSLIYTALTCGQFSFLVSIFTLIICLVLGFILSSMRHTVGYEIISNENAERLKRISMSGNIHKVDFFTQQWTSKQSITVLFYEQKNPDHSKQDITLSTEKLRIKKNFIEQIYKNCHERELDSDSVIVLLNNKIKSKENLLSYIKILNSIHWSRFPKKLVILIEILDAKNVVANGFNRTVIAHS
ncbi:putative transmembrane protein [Vairimorpha necatrix]|uniref:Transmembrane protein n=1 Tax=Vairimorpha necatrix TaxID=6039 RepID=A0AAX4JG52_9MICR